MSNNNTTIGSTGVDTITISNDTDYVFIDDCMNSSDSITLTGLDTYIGNININSSGGSGPVLANGSTSWNTGTVTFTDPVDELRERLEKLEAMIAEEKEIRDNCPAVRNAYDEYRFLLVLAKRNKGDLLTDN